tara:strand:+ start:201 stop:623 length:423 start_codon:yes stop_codon:yes gene_type:complete
MYNAAQNIISAMEMNIFNVTRVDARIREEVPFFKKILIENLDNQEVFHGYINKIGETWGIILKDNFKRLITHYNNIYKNDLLLQAEKQAEMVRLAEQYNADKLFSELDELSLTGNISSLTTTLSSSGISKKKRPSRKKRT